MPHAASVAWRRMAALQVSEARLYAWRGLERAVDWGRLAGAGIALSAGLLLPDLGPPFVGLLVVFLLVHAVLVGGARVRGRAIEEHLRLRQVSATADVAAFGLAMFVFSPDPLWAVPTFGGLVIITSSFRSGAGAAIPYAAALSTAYVAIDLFRAQVLGHGLEVLRLVSDLAVYQLMALIVRGIQGQLVVLGVQREYRELYDALTGLPNRALLFDVGERSILAAGRERSTVALLVVKLEHFTDVNNAFGYEAGDLLLQQVAPRLLDSLPEGGVIARLDGAEFAALLPGADGAAAVVAAQKFLHALEPPVVVAEQPLDVEATVGIALYPEHGAHADDLLRRAEIAARAARAAGSDHALASRLEEGHASHLVLAGEFRRAVERDELVLHYQPKVSMKTSRIVGVEALVRWRHPQRGLLAPDEFIPIIERTALMKPLTRWVLGTALRDCRAWRMAGYDLTVSVNVSMRNVMDPQLPEMVRALLEAAGAQPAWCALEITESVLMEDPQRAMATLSRLRRIGVQLVIDDFGTGYSSLAYLHRLSVDEVKIDKSFVLNISTDESNVAIARATIELGRSLDFETVAEGVEDRGTWEVLNSLGCDMAQGHHIAPPMSGAELERWLKESPWVSRGNGDPPVAGGI